MVPSDAGYIDLTGVNPYNPEKARALLKEAGVQTPLNVTLTLPPPPYARKGGEILASQLAKVGVNAKIENVEWAQWLSGAFKGNYDLTVVNHVEPHDIGNYANPKYYWHYDSPTVQKLIADAKTAPTEAERVDLLKQAAKQISEDSPADWILLAADLTVAKKNITGYPTNDSASRFPVAAVVVGS
jgi:peptide/nickel transport system substrate-binding protein